MLIKNHLFLSLVLAGITLTISNTSSASDSFTSLSACRNHFNTVVQAGNQSTEASDPWCKTKMTALDFCTEQALMTSLSTTSVNASQVPALRNSLQATCQQQLAAQATAGAGTGTGTASTGGAAFDASGRPNPPTPPAQQNCSSVATAEQAACNVRLAQYQRDLQTYQSNLQAYNQRQAAAQQQQQQQAAQQQQQQMQMNMQGMQMMLGVAAPLLEGGRGRDSGNSSSNNGNNGRNNGGYDNNGNARSGGYNTPFGGNTAAEVDRSIAETERQLARIDAPQARTPAETRGLGGQAGAAAKETAAAVPGAPVQDVANAPTTADGAGIPAAELETDLTTAAQQREQRIRQAQENISQRVQYLTDSSKSIAFNNVIAAYQEIVNDFVAYVEDKKLCVKKAELANKLCIEGRSPGARAAKALVDFSGPVLAMMASAQKACSGTRKVMNLAAVGMTVAKGVCVASKMTCDAKCADTATKLQAIEAKVTAVEAKLRMDLLAGKTDCGVRATQQGAAANTATICANDLGIKSRTVQVINPMLQAELRQEGAPQGGSTAQMIANCQEKGKDILLMATNIMGMMMAKSGAKKCEEQLAASAGTTGASGDISTADYCANAATSGTQFCKCQSNPTGEGCAANLAGGGALGDANNQRGANLKASQGVNGFAGGGPRGSGSNFNLGGGSNGTESGAALASLEAGGSVTGAAGAGSGGSVAGSAGSAAAADGTGNGVKPGEKSDDKKWNFGSFVPGGGGAMGSRGGQGGGNGNLTSQQQEAIERKIASERYSAEITTSSGKSNFDKIKSAVRQISSTLDPNQ